MAVPMLELAPQNASVKDQILQGLSAIIDRSSFVLGENVKGLEAELAEYSGARYAVGMSSGTDALLIALMALDIKHGDEVILPSFTFFATAGVVSRLGATPVFIDIDPETFNITGALVEAAITPRTKAIIPVHLFGQMADMDPILQLARRRGIPVIEDACQAHGALYQGKKAGSLGVAGCFSFYPGKNLGAFGEAGAVVTHDATLSAKLQVLRDHGQARKYFHSDIGWNARMDGIQGAVLRVKLKYLESSNQQRRAHASLYNELLSATEQVITPFTAPDNQHIYHIYAVRVRERDRLLQAMAERGIACAIHYPVPIHLQEAYRSLGYGEGSFPVAERCAREFLSLPMYPELSGQQIRTVVAELKTCLGERKPQECVA